jgi:hypothetical protein
MSEGTSASLVDILSLSFSEGYEHALHDSNIRPIELEIPLQLLQCLLTNKPGLASSSGRIPLVRNAFLFGHVLSRSLGVESSRAVTLATDLWKLWYSKVSEELKKEAARSIKESLRSFISDMTTIVR